MDRRLFLSSALASAMSPWPAQARAAPRPTGYLRTNWSRDPFSLGSYSFIANGAKREDHRTLGSSHGDHIFFAGEAAHPRYNSTVHAAYETGLFAASQVADTGAERVCIVGAGISGLAAGNALSKAGRSVTVVEARDRIGGRIWTDSGLGLPLDLGASWIHTIDKNPIKARADALGIMTKITSDSYILRGGDGRIMSDQEAPDWLEDIVQVQHSLGAGSDKINSRAYLSDLDYDGADVLLPGGYAQILDGLTRTIDLRLGHVVTAIRDTGRGVDVADSGGATLGFDAVIVTVPLGVLKAKFIRFEPALSAQKQEAIARLGMGVLDKLYLRFDAVFWDAEISWILTPETGLAPGAFNQWFNLFPYTGEPIVVGFNGGENARDLSGLSEKAFLDRGLSAFVSAYS